MDSVHGKRTYVVCVSVIWTLNTHTLTYTKCSYPSVAVIHKSSPSWHSSTVVKLASSTVSTGDTRGGAGGGEQPSQHSPSAEPSLEFMASTAKPGWGWWGPKYTGIPGVK